MKLYKLSAPAFDPVEFQRFLSDENLEWSRTPSATLAEEVVEVSGRICYLSFGQRQSPRDNKAYIKNLLAKEHESVLEHVSWTFLLTGVSRSFTHQLVRHRIGFSYSQLSQQYYDESEASFVMPPTIASSPVLADIWKESIDQSQEAYRRCLLILDEELPDGSDKSRRERTRLLRSEARSVLPNATETKIVVTTNARAIRHFLRVRGATVGDIECREVSAAIFRSAQLDAPSLFDDFEILEGSDGHPLVSFIG